MNAQDKLTSIIKAWFDAQPWPSYVHHDNERTTTLDGQFDLGELAAHLLAEVAKVNAASEVATERERCVREIERAADEYASAGVPFSGACRSLARRIAMASVTASSQSPPADPPAA